MKKVTLKLTIIVFVIGALFSQQAFAQKIKWGETNKASSKRYYPSIKGEDAGNIYTFAVLKNDFIVESYSKDNMKKRYSKIIEQPKIDKYRVDIERVNYVGDKFLVFASYYDKKAKIYNFYAFTVNASNGNLIDKHVKLFSINVEKKRRKGTFNVFLSKDGNRILLNHYAYYKKQKQYKDKYKLIDADLNVLLKREDIFNKKERDYSTSSYLIDNDGSLYFFKKYNNRKLFVVAYDANKDYEKWEEKVDLSKFGLGPKASINNLDLNVNAKNDLVISGYYSSGENNRSDFDGCFFMKIDNRSKETVVTELNEFDKSFKDQFLTKRQAKKGKDAKVKNEFKSIEIINKDDGGILLVGEMYYHTIYRDSKGNTVGETFMYLDLVVLNISPKGKLIWANRVPKKQIFSVSYSFPFNFGSYGMSMFWTYPDYTKYMSYLIGMDKTNAYVIFNDNPKNLLSSNDTDRTKAYKKPKKGVVNMFEINLETGVKKEKLFLDAKDFDIYLCPNVTYQKNQESNVITFGMKGKNYKYGELSFD